MTIGLPRALAYYRYGVLWQAFFERLGCQVVLSVDTNQKIMDEGIGRSVSECCLPVKVFLGHVASLTGRCDYIFIPRLERSGKYEEFCVRFWGLPDVARNTFPNLAILACSQRGSELASFLRLGPALGKSRAQIRRAYRIAKKAQQAADAAQARLQRETLRMPGLKVLLAAHPYVAHDPWLGGPLVRMVREGGAAPVFADRCDRSACHALSKQISKNLYWTMNKEVIGSIPLLQSRVDGVILVTAFPCATDSLVNELLMRRVKTLPLTHIVLDEQQGEAGLHTRIECFLDILKQRRQANA